MGQALKPASAACLRAYDDAVARNHDFAAFPMLRLPRSRIVALLAIYDRYETG
jgi:hypothetical protein